VHLGEVKEKVAAVCGVAPDEFDAFFGVSLGQGALVGLLFYNLVV